MGKAVIVDIPDSSTGAEVLTKLTFAGVINVVKENGMNFVAGRNVNKTTLMKHAKKHADSSTK